ncbi:MAG: glycosyltransferase [Candidatus Nanoarchaeia archaeon]|jgi:glycosyltransferase involved in cell wall biosynthesis
MNQPKVSVIVATKNEERNIGVCLKSLMEQSYKNIEIIVVDNGSSDRTCQIAGRYARVYVLNKKNKVKNFRGAQVNLGVKKSKGGIIFFPDADMTFDKDLIKEAVVELNHFDALFVPEIVVGNGFFGKVRNFERSFYNETCIDGVRFTRKSAFKAIGGFDVKNITFGPDDWDFTKSLKKAGFKLGITKKPLFHHEEWMTFSNYLEKKKKYVGTFDGYINKWGLYDADIKKQFSPFYRLFCVFFEDGKFLRILRHPFLTIGLYYSRLMVALNYFLNKKSFKHG